MKKLVSNAALNRIITAHRSKGAWCKWNLSFSTPQAKEEGLSEKQIKIAHKAFGHYNGVAVIKSEMIEIVYASITEAE